MRAIPILAAVVAGIASTAAAYFILGIFAFGFAHTLSDFAFYLYFAVLMGGSPAVGVIMGVLTYRVVKAEIAARASPDPPSKSSL
jgi:hypothetical protein